MAKNQSYKFPVYLKYINEKSFFKVSDADTFEQVIRIGSHIEVMVYKANDYPTRLFISDMLANEGKRWVKISESEYQSILDES